MKVKMSEIKDARYISKSPLVVSITYTDGSSDQSNYWTLWTSYTTAAYDKIMKMCKENNQTYHKVERKLWSR